MNKLFLNSYLISSRMAKVEIKISVVIPAKNRARTLPSCLDSVLAQTFPPTEVIVVDDGSNDDTKQIVESYSNRSVRYVRLIDGAGAQAARNLGIRLATHDWIAFQDSDDIWLETKNDRQIKELVKYHFDPNKVIYCDCVRREVNTGICSYMDNGDFEGNSYSKLLVKPGPMFQGILVSKSALQRIGFLDEKCPSYQEWETSIRLAKLNDFVHIKEALFEWHWHDGETISKDVRRNILGYQYVIEKHKDEIIAHHGQRGWRRVMAMNMTRALRYTLWDEVQKMIQSEPWHPLFALAGLFARYKVAPRGIGRLLRLAAL